MAEAAPPVTAGEGWPMANNVRLRVGRHLEQRASSRRLLTAQLFSRGDPVDRVARSAGCRDVIKQPPRPSRSRRRAGSASVSTTRGHEACQANAMGPSGADLGICPLITQTAIAGHCRRRYCFLRLAAQCVVCRCVAIGRRSRMAAGGIQIQAALPIRAADQSTASRPPNRPLGRLVENTPSKAVTKLKSRFASISGSDRSIINSL